jgi:hypothetical protein
VALVLCGDGAKLPQAAELDDLIAQKPYQVRAVIKDFDSLRCDFQFDRQL